MDKPLSESLPVNVQSRPRRVYISQEEWNAIAPLLPVREGGRSDYLRRYFEAATWLCVNESVTWRDLPENYGKWNSIYRFFRRWTQAGTLDAIAKALRKEIEAKQFLRHKATHERRAYRRLLAIRKKIKQTHGAGSPIEEVATHKKQIPL